MAYLVEKANIGLAPYLYLSGYIFAFSGWYQFGCQARCQIGQFSWQFVPQTDCRLGLRVWLPV